MYAIRSYYVLGALLASCGGSADAGGTPKIGVAIYKFDDTFMRNNFV